MIVKPCYDDCYPAEQKRKRHFAAQRRSVEMQLHYTGIGFSGTLCCQQRKLRMCIEFCQCQKVTINRPSVLPPGCQISLLLFVSQTCSQTAPLVPKLDPHLLSCCRPGELNALERPRFILIGPLVDIASCHDRPLSFVSSYSSLELYYIKHVSSSLILDNTNEEKPPADTLNVDQQTHPVVFEKHFPILCHNSFDLWLKIVNDKHCLLICLAYLVGECQISKLAGWLRLMDR
ncbi:hypothetical protein T4B_1104 [Trichinella pseudospiralis]|uniref:Uncharacterized protein n=1 Tax=Trichinella pseudospiralis TaxID=6337 RepID=A0A0V1IGW0_TRIPS|nr:hypothetical protein T4B_1104 [Trichinella pseudospiralis]